MLLLLKSWCFWTVVLEKTPESLLDSKEIKPVNPNGNQSRIFIGKTDAEAEAPILWPPDVKNWLNGKDPGAGKDWRQEEKGIPENEMVGWHHRPIHVSLSRLQELVMDREAWHALWDSPWGSPLCSPWGRKESNTTEWLNWIKTYVIEIEITVSLPLLSHQWHQAHAIL